MVVIGGNILKQKMRSAENILILGIVICMIISGVIAIVYKWDNERLVIENNKKDYPIVNVDNWWIDYADIQGEQYVVEGWISRLGTNLDNVDRRIVLIDENGQLYKMNTIMVTRQSVTEHFNDGNNYDNAGIKAACLVSDLKPNTTYTIGILINDGKDEAYLVETDTKLEL